VVRSDEMKYMWEFVFERNCHDVS